MSFDEKIAALIQRLPKLVGDLQTEEATKNALVMPFISALGYDVFNPKEVVPEYTADVGIKKGEKVDYAIVRDGQVIILMECKKAGTELRVTEMSQLYRYFGVSKARIAVLTNGVQYLFYSDLVAPNMMDLRPFLEFDLSDPRPIAIAEVKKMAKDDFDLDRMLSTATELKNVSEIKKVLASQLEAPDEEFVRFFFSRTNPNTRFMASAREQFTPLVSRAYQQFIGDKVNDRLRSALEREEPQEATTKPAEQTVPAEQSEAGKTGIVTTPEEMEGFYIVRAIAAKTVAVERVAHRDAKSYMAILLDDNNRKPICRLWFNGKQKYVSLFDDQKAEKHVPIENLAGIYAFSDDILKTIASYEPKAAV